MNSDPYSLELLEPMVPPDSVGLFPLAVGWWFLMAIAAVWLIYRTTESIAKYRSNAYRREGLHLIEQLGSSDDFQAGLRRADEVVKRVAMVAYDRETVAKLWGKDWVEFLQSKVDSISLSKSQTTALQSVAVTSLPPDFSRDDYQAVLGFASDWIRTHQAGGAEC